MIRSSETIDINLKKIYLYTCLIIILLCSLYLRGSIFEFFNFSGDGISHIYKTSIEN